MLLFIKTISGQNGIWKLPMKNIDKISITGAKVHNLKNLSLEIPKNKFVVVTGPSGSGKSSLAFDTIYIEGQRRYIESLSSYARQFIGQFQAPDVDSIEGLSPAIAIDQKTSSKNPRSTVGTVTEIYDYMRILFAKVGTPHCPDCGKTIQGQTTSQIIKSVLQIKQGSKVQILSPVITNKKGEHKELLSKYQVMGFSRIRLNGEFVLIDEDLKIAKTKNNSIELVIDRIVMKEGIQKRVADSVELALKLANGSLVIFDGKKNHYFNEKNYCSQCEISFPNIEPRSFSFNSPLGACAECNGLGESKNFDMDSMILDPSFSIKDGAITPISKKNSFLYNMVTSILAQEKVSLDTPYDKLPKKIKDILWKGSSKTYTYSFTSENSKFEFKKAFPGIVEWLAKKYRETTSEKTKKSLEEYMRIRVCESCDGARLNPYGLNILINKKNIIELCDYSIDGTMDFFEDLSFKGEKQIISEKLMKEIKGRLSFLLSVGLDYLSLNRSASTLSGGESQRIRLATQIGSSLSGILYVLDEPSIGLHPRDNDKLIKTIQHLRDIGNTVLVVEHDEETMRASDLIIDMGPGAGEHGGEIVAMGTADQIGKNKNSLTGKYLANKASIPLPEERYIPEHFIKLSGASHNNLKKIDIKIPTECMVCITGVSGSGKSTLVHEILVPAIRYNLTTKNKVLYKRNNYQSITGLEPINSVIELDQSPIGRTPNSNPATYSGVFDIIRNLFASSNESQVRGYTAGRFSFNVKGGRCDACEGNGVKKIEMHFLPDVYVLCDECEGSRFNDETLSILYRGKSIADVLEMTIEEAHTFFKNHTRISRILATLNNVGLGYMKLGQPATTLSGGEAQRLKLSKELAKRAKGHCFYVLDEPTTGLHFSDIKLLLKCVQTLVDQGHTVLVIEHNLDVIKCADYLIDLGPEGGAGGGNLVAYGTPEDVAQEKSSYTGKYLKKLL